MSHIEYLKSTEEYKELGFKIVTCPICGRPTLDMFYVCDYCGWEYDGATLDEEYSSCNKSTVKQYKEMSKN